VTLFRGPSGVQQLEFQRPHASLSPRGPGVPRRFRDRLEAAAFLRGLAGDPSTMTGLRELLRESADSAATALLTDGEVVEQLAARLVSGALAVVITQRPRVPPPQGEEVEEAAPRAPTEEKADQDVEFEITDHFDEPYSGLEWVLTYPDGKTKKTGTLGDDGKVQASSVPPGSYQLAFKIVSAARWGEPQIEVDKEVKLLATAAGFDPGIAGKFEVFDSRGLDRKPLARVDGKVNAARVLEAVWTPSQEALKDMIGGGLVFRAKINASSALSGRAPVAIRRSFELSDLDGPLPDTSVVARFSGGHETTADSKGGKLELLVPFNQKLVWIDFPEHPGAHLTVEPDDGEAVEYLLCACAEDAGAAAAEEEEAIDDSDAVNDEEEESDDEEQDGAGGEEASA
jgi:hypothetical protein